ncbi:MAG: hypothetical protein AAB425_12900, partial [Bdellovibrionota bacterium]
SDVFGLPDYANRKTLQIRLRNSDGAKLIETWAPASEHPNLRFQSCTQTVRANLSKVEFEALVPASEPSLANPHVICLDENVEVNVGGSLGVTISQPNVHVIGTSINRPTFAALRLVSNGNTNEAKLDNVKLVNLGAMAPLYAAGTSIKTVTYAEIYAPGTSGILFGTDARQNFRLRDSMLFSTGDDRYGIYIDANYPTMEISNSIIHQTGLYNQPVYFRGFQGALTIRDSQLIAAKGYKAAVRVHQKHTVTITGSTLQGCYAALDVNVSNTVSLADNVFKKAADPECSSTYPAIKTYQTGNILNDTSTGAGNLACNISTGVKGFAAFWSGTDYTGSFDPALTRNRGNLDTQIVNCN